MSDRLDIVRLIDAKVTSTRRTVTRSKQLADMAKDELHIHEDWLRHHHERTEGDLKRHQRRMKRRERVENNKRFAISAALFLPRLCVGLCRGVASGLRKADAAVAAGSARLGGAAYASARSLNGRFATGITWVGSKAHALWLVLAAAFSLTLSWLDKSARAIVLTTIGATSRALSWLGPRTSDLGHWVIASVSLNLPRLAANIGSVGLQLGSGAKRQASHIVNRSRPKARRQTSHVFKRSLPKSMGPESKPAPDLDPGRLQQAAFVRLRGEHDRLQRRIHAMDRRHEQRLAHRSQTDAREWADLRRLAANAQRLFEVQQRQVLGPAGSSEEGALVSEVAEQHAGMTSVHPLRAGHAIYEAPALLTGHRRA